MPDHDQDIALALAAFELPAQLEARLAEPQPRPTRRRAGPLSTNRDEAAVAELTNRPARARRAR